MPRGLDASIFGQWIKGAEWSLRLLPVCLATLLVACVTYPQGTVEGSRYRLPDSSFSIELPYGPSTRIRELRKPGTFAVDFTIRSRLADSEPLLSLELFAIASPKPAREFFEAWEKYAPTYVRDNFGSAQFRLQEVSYRDFELLFAGPDPSRALVVHAVGPDWLGRDADLLVAVLPTVWCSVVLYAVDPRGSHPGAELESLPSWGHFERFVRSFSKRRPLTGTLSVIASPCDPTR